MSKIKRVGETFDLSQLSKEQVKLINEFCHMCKYPFLFTSMSPSKRDYKPGGELFDTINKYLGDHNLKPLPTFDPKDVRKTKKILAKAEKETQRIVAETKKEGK